MSVVAEFTVPAEALPGGDALVEMPDVRIEIERIVPTQEAALPFFWVWGEQPERFMERAGMEPNVADVDLLERFDGGALFRAEWSPEAELIEGIKRLNATIIEATGTSDHWRFEVRTQDPEAFTSFQEVFEQQGISVHLQRLYDLAELVEGDTQPVTPKQRETLLTAYREGYYDNPREISQAELGAHFGISNRAVSDRLRRGTRNLIAMRLFESSDI
ncbi:helix-turn-helix domain-containing protein [Natronorarus salvus]|uniref:helix-turn-helix domain-containing protein n=1 Tax=Natronorarus salvus TaxID=3117733 RepID=UPI002F25F5E1